jgi:N,N-dimethylformamidase
VTAPLTGYAGRVSIRAGKTISFKVSSSGPGPFNAALVRIICGDPNPAGRGTTLEDHSEQFDSRFPSKIQHAWPGSYAIVEGAAAVVLPQALSIEALIWPTLPADGPQTVISRRDGKTGAGFALVLTPDGMVLEVGDAKVSVGKGLRAHTWYRVWASADASTGMLRVGQQPLKRAFAVEDEGDASVTAPTPLALESAQAILIGAEAGSDRAGAALLQRQDRGAVDLGRRNLGLLAPHGLDGDRGHRPQRPARKTGQPADAGDERRGLDRRRARLEARAASLRCDPFPRRRSA